MKTVSAEWLANSQISVKGNSCQVRYGGECQERDDEARGLKGNVPLSNEVKTRTLSFLGEKSLCIWVSLGLH